jgi:hypothetical protein
MDRTTSLIGTVTDETRGGGNESEDLDRPPERGLRTSSRAHQFVLAGGAYLLMSLFLWWHVWTGHPTSITTCGCGDSSSSIWFISWSAFAISHGQNPLFSTAIGYPTGINLIFASYGIVLAPVTWLFGPVAALNVGLTISPVLSALAMFALVRRWVRWVPAAFCAGLFYGFSPFVLNNLSVAHADFGMVGIPPLVIICLDDLLIRQRRHPFVTGTCLGLLISLQFFIGIEILLILIIEVIIGLAVVVVYAAKRNLVALRGHARHATTGCAAAAVATLALLAYPTWFSLAGPAHFTDTVHPGLQLSAFEASTRYFLLPAMMSGEWQHIVGGYQGPVLTSLYSSEYLGIGAFVVSLGGLVFLRRDRLLWLLGILTFVTLLLATSSGAWLAVVPGLKDIVPLHFALFVYLTVAVILGVVVDCTRSAMHKAQRARLGLIAVNGISHRWRKVCYPWIATFVGLMVAALAIGPPAVYLAKSIPMTVQPVILPTWFRVVAPKLHGHPVVLALPAPFTVTKPGLTWQEINGQRSPFAIGWKQAALTWQALSGQRYSIVGGGGLAAGLSHRAGENQGQTVITEVTFAYGSMPKVTTDDIAAVHRALSEWGVNIIVLPDDSSLPQYESVATVTGMAALIGAATGARPDHIANAWVWNRIDEDVPKRFPDAAQYAQCTGDRDRRGAVAVQRTVACVLAARLLVPSSASS